MSGLQIGLLEPWYGGSHRRWADGLVQYSEHHIEILSLPARHWKWRMHGAAVTLARQVIHSGSRYDLFLVSDMMDVAVFISLIRQAGIRTPVVAYFHENQISYPVSPRDTDVTESRDLHYGWINYTSALAVQKVYFNSHYHKDSFLSSLPEILKRYPDSVNLETVDEIVAKSDVLPLGLDLRALDEYRPSRPETKAVPLILWNHRWEFDKCPEAFLQILLQLHQRGLTFEVALLGERGSGEPSGLAETRKVLGPAIVHDGPVEAFADYARWLWRSDILPVTSIQDFFGGSVVEAIYTGNHPVLPRRLAYPEHLDDKRYFYEHLEEAVDSISALIESGAWREPCQQAGAVGRYDWARLSPRYDAAFTAAVSSTDSSCHQA
ncbi:MAG: DUF3524 domain-containing protein [Puniceicoccaceae bacterium]